MFLNIDLGCECQTLILSLKGDVLFRYPQAQGIYQRSGKMVGKSTWISSLAEMAIWYNSPNMDWMIGPLSYLGGSIQYIDGFGDQGKLSCPYTVPNNTWKYKTREWVVPDNIDINVKCLAGKETLFRDHLFKTSGNFHNF